MEDDEEGVEGEPCALLLAPCTVASNSEHADAEPQLAIVESAVTVRDDEGTAIAAAAWRMFEANWLLREEQICRWRRARAQLPWTWPTTCVSRTFLRAWCEAAFAVDTRRTVAASVDRELDGLFVVTGNVPTWRHEWLALRSRWWCSERTDRSLRVQLCAQLYQCFAAWALAVSCSAEFVVTEEEGCVQAEECPG